MRTEEKNKTHSNNATAKTSLEKKKTAIKAPLQHNTSNSFLFAIWWRDSASFISSISFIVGMRCFSWRLTLYNFFPTFFILQEINALLVVLFDVLFRSPRRTAIHILEFTH